MDCYNIDDIETLTNALINRLLQYRLDDIERTIIILYSSHYDAVARVAS